MSRRPTHFPTTVADCHKLILDLHAALALRELHAARLREGVAARCKRLIAKDGTDQSSPFHAVFPIDENRHKAF